MVEQTTAEKCETKARVKSRLQISVTPQTEQKLKLLADAMGLSVPEVGTRALDEWIELNFAQLIAFWAADLT